MSRIRVAALEAGHHILEALALLWESRHVKKMGAQSSAIVVGHHLLTGRHVRVVFHDEIILVLLGEAASKVDCTLMNCNFVLLHLGNPFDGAGFA